MIKVLVSVKNQVSLGNKIQSNETNTEMIIIMRRINNFTQN